MSQRWDRLELLGTGASGKVWRAYLRSTGATLAAKRIEMHRDLSASQSGRSALLAALHELDTMLSLPPCLHIIRLYGSQVEEEELEGARQPRQYLTIFTELAVGGSVASLVRRVGALEEAVVRSFTRQIALGLQFLHSHGVLHRDIKGANVLLAGEGGDTIKLADFGNAQYLVKFIDQAASPQDAAGRPGQASVASVTCCCSLWGSSSSEGSSSSNSSSSSSTSNSSSSSSSSSSSKGEEDKDQLKQKQKQRQLQEEALQRAQRSDVVSLEALRGRLAGTPHFMAPEVIMQLPNVNLPSDIWSLGCTVLEMLTGEQPWGA
jgi:serine/threonine protein kinase